MNTLSYSSSTKSLAPEKSMVSGNKNNLVQIEYPSGPYFIVAGVYLAMPLTIA